MSKGLVVAVKGAIGSGKSTLAEGLALYRDFIVLPLSDPVKGAVDDLNARSRWMTKKIDLSGRVDHRNVWQMLGNDCRYELRCPEVWCNIAAMKIRLVQKLRDVLGAKPFFVIPDFRHPEEFSYFHEFCLENDFDLVVIETVRNNCTNENDKYAVHDSETQRDWIEADFIAYNDSTVANLIEQALLMIDPYIREYDADQG